MQPEPRLDPNKCELKPISEPVRYGWPTQLTVVTRDQYGDAVYVPNLKVICRDYFFIETHMKESENIEFNKLFLLLDTNQSDAISKRFEWESKRQTIVSS